MSGTAVSPNLCYNAPGFLYLRNGNLMEINSLIQTKLQPPSLSPDILPRPQLIERLNDGRYRKLTLISAPAGYGKSVLASAWTQTCGCSTTWLSLDKNDNDLTMFLSYFVAAVQTLFPDSCQETEALLNAQQMPPSDYLTTTLINETAVIPEPFVIVLDDYHLIAQPDIHQLLTTFIQYQSEKMHLMIVTREDPLLGVPALRAKNQLTEIRGVDLCFNEEEIVQFLNQDRDVPMTTDLAAKLARYTEGWPAGLRLARLALRGQAETAVFQENLDHSNQYVMSYLLDEVLAQQPQALQNFLMKTAVLDRFCPALCDALPGEPVVSAAFVSSRDIIQHLIQTNLFIISLDGQGEWFRYHHLFQELLLAKLKTESTPTELAALHHAAGNWLADNGYVPEALDHYFQANDIDAAVQLIASQRYALLNSVQWLQLGHYLSCFSPAAIEQYPELLIIKTWLMYHHGQWRELPLLLQKLETLSQATLPAEALDHLRGEMSALHALLSYFAAQPEQAISQAHSSLEKSPPELWIVRVLARACLGGALQMVGDLSGAYTAVYDGLAHEQEQSDHFKAVLIQTACNIYWLAADLNGVAQAAEQSLRLIQNNGVIGIQGMAHYQLGSVQYMQNNLAEAETHFSFLAQKPYVNYGNQYVYSVIGLALTYLAQEKPDEAQQTARSLVDFLLKTKNVSLLPVAQAFQAEMALRRNKLIEAGQWAAQFKQAPPLTPAFRFYIPHLTLAKIWLAQDSAASRQQAADLLADLKAFFTSTHNTRFLLETLAIQALLYSATADEEQAAAALEQSLRLALPGRFVRLFVDLGDKMAFLLSKLTLKEPELDAYRARLLAAFAPFPHSAAAASLINGKDSPAHSLVDPLTEREMEVLRLLAQRHTNQEIAQQLIISPYTVNDHLKNIYRKLGVHGRRQAAQRAQELGIILTE